MAYNKWLFGSLGCLVACAVPGGLGMMFEVLACIVCAGGCFVKWLVEEDKCQREKNLEKFEK